MFKSIFSKYFAVVSFIVCVTFIVLGVVQTVISANFWLDEKQKLMNENTEQVAKVAADACYLSSDGAQYVLNLERSNLPIIARLLCGAIDTEMFITDSRGVLLCSATGETAPQGNSVPSAFLREIPSDRTYFGVGTLGGMYEKTDQQYVSSAPICKGGEMIGYVFAVSPAHNLTLYLISNVKTYLLTMLGVLLLAMLLTYWFTARLVRPLRNMSEAVRRFGAGDFSYRIPVKGHDEVASLAASLNTMATSLAASEDASRSFVANVSHELRTPMTTIGGFIDGILDGTIPPEKQNYYLGIASDEVKRLSRLVRSMLDLSRIDNGSLKLTPREMDLTELCCHTLLSFEQRIEQKQLHIEGLDACEPCPVTADVDLIAQTVYNLVDNAVKFTNEGGTITVQTERKSDRVGLLIRNTGEGVAGEELPHIFDRFYKSDKSRGLDKSGAGLGLFLVKSIVNLHGGEIYVRSAEHAYCEFYFWLPLTPQNIFEISEKSSKKSHN